MMMCDGIALKAPVINIVSYNLYDVSHAMQCKHTIYCIFDVTLFNQNIPVAVAF